MKKKLTAEELKVLERRDNKEWKLLTSVFFVEANSFAIHSLWKEYQDIWVQDLAGLSQVIGYVADRPINVEFSFAHIKGHRICFYHGCSQLVDHKMIDDFIDKDYSDSYDETRRTMCDADNFHLALQYIEELNKENAEIKEA